MTPLVQRHVPKQLKAFARVLGIAVLDQPFEEPSSNVIKRCDTLPSLYDASGTCVRSFTLTRSQYVELNENPRASNAARLARGVANEFHVRVKLEFEGKTVATYDPR